jgi:predicted enzyme related to lactoylglutathione lyase
MTTRRRQEKGYEGSDIMGPGIKTIMFPVEDLAGAKALFRDLLGVEPYADEPYYVGFRAGDQEIGLDPNGHKKGMTGPVGYWHVDDVEASLQRLLDAGARTQQPVKDLGGGRLSAIARDPTATSSGSSRHTDGPAAGPKRLLLPATSISGLPVRL